MERCEREEERGKAIDGKLTALLAGVLACIGFAVRTHPSPFTAVELLLYLIPLGVLLNAFLTERGGRAATPDALLTFFPAYPVTTLRDAVVAMTRAFDANRRINDTKTARLDVAALLIVVVTFGVLLTQVVLDLR